MKNIIIPSVKHLMQDRLLLLMSIGILLLISIYIVYVSFVISPTELQIATHYSAFGDTQYYRNKWYYLFNFIVFGVVVAFFHIGAMAKLREREMRPLAIALGGLTFIMILILFLLTHSVLGIAYLS